VLIVDDDPLFRESLRSTLEPDLEVVAEAVDGREAVAIASAGGVDLVVMDVSMPRLSGIGATRELIERDPALMVVILTGSEGEHEQDALAAGARAYVHKSSGLAGLTELLLGLGELPPAPDEAPPAAG
jgi:DNA-binding NarL/FixJ family response regulator